MFYVLIHVRGPKQCLQVFEGLEFCKSHIVTTGVPGSTCPDAIGGPETTEGPDSPRSLLSPLSSIDSRLSSLHAVAGLRDLRILGPDHLKIARDVKGGVETASVADSDLRRSLRNHGTEEKKVRDCCLCSSCRLASGSC